MDNKNAVDTKKVKLNEKTFSKDLVYQIQLKILGEYYGIELINKNNGDTNNNRLDIIEYFGRFPFDQ
jgi:hypothetical protein